MTTKQLQKAIATELAKMPDLFTLSPEKLRSRIWTLKRSFERSEKKAA